MPRPTRSGYIGVLWIAFDKRKQGWHDNAAKTVVVRDEPD